MDTQIPALEFWTVVKWVVVLLVVFGLKEFAALMARKWFYGSQKHDRRTDTDDTRGWIERFLENQREHTQATIDLGQSINKILAALQENGNAIRDFTERSECKYEGHKIHAGRRE